MKHVRELAHPNGKILSIRVANCVMLEAWNDPGSVIFVPVKVFEFILVQFDHQ